MKMKVQFYKAGKWADKPWEPQFTVGESEVKEVSPELASVILKSGAGKIYEETAEDNQPETDVDNDGAADGDGSADAEKTPVNPEDVKINDLGLVDALVKKLAENGVKNVPQLVEKSEAEILDMNGIGKAKVDDIVDALEKIGLSLKEGE